MTYLKVPSRPIVHGINFFTHDFFAFSKCPCAGHPKPKHRHSLDAVFGVQCESGAPALGAELALAHRMIALGLDADDLLTTDLQADAATYAAVGADAGDDIGRAFVVYRHLLRPVIKCWSIYIKHK